VRVKQTKYDSKIRALTPFIHCGVLVSRDPLRAELSNRRSRRQRILTDVLALVLARWALDRGGGYMMEIHTRPRLPSAHNTL